MTKKTTKKKVVKKVAKKVSKKVVKKTAKKKPTATKKVSPPKVTTKKPASKKAVTKKKVTKKTVKKTTKKVVKKAPAKKTSPAKAPAKDTKKPDAKPAENAATTKKAGPNKRRRSSKPKKPLVLPDRPLLLGPNGPALKPLIPSHKTRQSDKSVLDNVTSRRTKTPFNKTQLEHYQHLLLVKRAQLSGDVKQLEQESDRSVFGSRNESQQIDEQGSENYEQSLIQNIASTDRERIYEIDEALKRITDRTYGLCLLTHEPIKKARLEEIPWTRYTIAAARELDRRGGHHR